MDLLQVAQRATDLDRATAFYARLLGVPAAATFDPPGLVFFRLGEVRLLLDRNAPSSLVYLRVEDFHATVARLRADGAAFEGEPHVIFTHGDDTLGPADHDEWHAFLRDTEGNLIALVGLVPTD